MRHHPPVGIPRRFLGLAWLALAGVLSLAGGPAVGAEGTGTVRGLVVGEDGQPVAEARVRVLRFFDDRPFDPFATAFETRTDPRGRFAAPLPEGSYLAVVTQGHLAMDAADQFARYWWVKAGETREEIRISLAPGARIEGRVVRKADGGAVANARVVLDTGPATTTEQDGRFVLDPVGPGEHEVMAVAPGFAWEKATVETWPAETAAVLLEMSPGFSVRGRVTDEQGRPVRGAVVADWASAEKPHRWMRRASTDAEGRYELSGFAFAAQVRSLVASRPDFANASREHLSPPKEGNVLPVDFVLTKGFAIEVEVRGPDGEPISGATVGHSWGGEKTDAKGRIRFDKLVSSYAVLYIAQAKGCAPASVRVPPPERGGVAPVTIYLDRGQTATGRVLDRQGRPVPGAKVHPWANGFT